MIYSSKYILVQVKIQVTYNPPTYQTFTPRQRMRKIQQIEL